MATLDPSAQYYHHARPDMQAMVPRECQRILDVGCGAGALGAALKQRQSCHVTGIELLPEVAALAAGVLDRVLVGDATKIIDTLPDGAFDGIVLGDVLEHLVDPGRCLVSLRRVLAPTGRLVVSVPNVRHWSVVRDLLEGHWRYTDQGILDRTHLRFFTRASFVGLITEAGFAVQSTAFNFLQGWEVPGAVVEALESCLLEVSTLWSEGRVFQYLFVLVPA